MFVNKYEQTNLTIKIVLKIHPHLVIKQHQTSLTNYDVNITGITLSQLPYIYLCNRAGTNQLE